MIKYNSDCYFGSTGVVRDADNLEVAHMADRVCIVYKIYPNPRLTLNPNPKP